MNQINEKSTYNFLNNNHKLNDKNKIYVYIFILFLAITTVTIIHENLQSEISINGVKISSQKKNKKQSCIYISGEINKEGIVCLDKNSNIESAIDKAGGVTIKADISIINLNKKILDGEKLHIISTTKSSEEKEQIIDKEAIGTDGKININKATKKQLETLKGIGPGTSNKIIEYRKNNVFENIEDLKDVNGIGDAKYKLIEKDICVK